MGAGSLWVVSLMRVSAAKGSQTGFEPVHRMEPRDRAPVNNREARAQINH